MTWFDSAWGVALTAGAGATGCFGLLGLLQVCGLDRSLLDRPNARSLHSRPTPRVGGLGILAGLLTGLVLSPARLPEGLWLGLALLAVVSLIDDLRGLGAGIRLTLHFSAAALASLTTLDSLGPWIWAVTVLTIAWSINLYNFMDGSDGLAGTMGVIGFATFAVLSWLGNEPSLAMACSAVAGACMGFLFFNLPPARLFMGDVGSTSLGLLAAALGALGVVRGLWTVWLPLTVFMPFVFDASATLIDRARRRCRLTDGHRDHAYQRMNLSGLGHWQTLQAYAALMSVNAVGAGVSWWSGAEREGALLSGAVHAALWILVRRTTRPRTDA